MKSCVYLFGSKHKESTFYHPLWKVEDSGWKFQEKGTKGIIVENIIHAFDLMRFLFGDVKNIYAEGDNFIFKSVTPPDSAICVMRLKNGAIASIGGGSTGDPRVSDEYLDAHFENGIAQIFGKLDRPFHLRILFRDQKNPEIHDFEGGDGIKEETSYFIDCIKNDTLPISTGEDGKKALELALAAIESIRSHKVIYLWK